MNPLRPANKLEKHEIFTGIRLSGPSLSLLRIGNGGIRESPLALRYSQFVIGR